MRARRRGGWYCLRGSEPREGARSHVGSGGGTAELPKTCVAGRGMERERAGSQLRALWRSWGGWQEASSPCHALGPLENRMIADTWVGVFLNNIRHEVLTEDAQAHQSKTV